MVDSLLARVGELVGINSGTRNREGVLAVQRRIARDLEAMGFHAEWMTHPDGEEASGPLLVSRWNTSGNVPIATLVCHADTVFEVENPFREFTVTADGKQAMGPGIIDDKGSVVVGVEACRRFLERAKKKGLGVQVVCSPNEEIGSPGWQKIFHQLSKASKVVFGLEPAADDGGIIIQRKGGRWYRVEVTGKEAHAGRAHHLGINAGHELALKIDKLQKLTDYDAGVTVNLGSFEGGGGKFNVVCGHAVGRFDIRYETLKAGKTVFPQIEKVLTDSQVGKGKKAAASKFEIEDDVPPLEPQKISKPFLDFHAKTLKRLEKKVSAPVSSGGNSDSSHFARPGLIVLDGVGACGGKIHTSDEFLTVSSLETRAEALCEMLMFSEKTFV